MKTKFHETIEIPAGVTCALHEGILKVSKSGAELSRKVSIPGIKVSMKDNTIVFEANGNKNHYKLIKSNLAHIKNMFLGIENKYVYILQEVHVHFPMTLKLEGNKLLINNFLGEKRSRVCNILPGVHVDIKGAIITVSSHDKEAAGQTAANMEKTTRVKYRDRRVFQDGIYITTKGGEE